MSAQAWTQDPRWLRAQQHAQRAEVLQAELLLRAVVQDHADCVPGWQVLADFAAERGDLDSAQHCLNQALIVAPDDTELQVSQARLQAAVGRQEEAQNILQRVVQQSPDHGVAWLMLAELREAHGDNQGALHARYQAVTRSQKAGRWVSDATTDPALLQTVLHQVNRLRQERRDHYFSAYDSVRQACGAASVARVDHALGGFLGEHDATPPDPRQRPKFLYFPGLPSGPFHDPDLQPWAPSLRRAWQGIRDEALGLLADDHDFESFLGLKPGQKAPQYVGGQNPNAAWDAFFFYRHGQRFDANHVRCPVTSGVLESIELCRIERQAPEVCFSVIRPQSTIVRHYGVTNTRLVMHLPLIVPPGCALNLIDAGEHHWKPGELMMFDDTYQHEAWNTSDEPRLILLMDCWNPHLSDPEMQAVKLLVEAIDHIEN